MKLFQKLFICFVFTIALINAQNHCDAGTCVNHEDCTDSGSVCCDGKCVIYNSVAVGDAGLGEDCICQGCSDEFTCNDNGICEASMYPVNSCGCTAHTDCITGYCTSDGLCRAANAEGGYCNTHGQCIGNLGCVNNVCTASTGAEGAACYSQGGFCPGDQTLCGFNGNDDVSVCAPVATIGSDCIGGDCGEWAFCDNKQKKCVAKRAPGEICDYSTDCASGTCAEDNTGTCKALGKINDVCNHHEYCEGNLICISRGSHGFCSNLRAGGETCGFSFECLSYVCTDHYCKEYSAIGSSCREVDEANCDPSTSFCDTTLNSCRALLKEAGDCENANQCEGDLVCLVGKCTALKAKGEDCTQFYECETAACVADVCAESPCGDALCALNETCYIDTHCQSGYCAGGVCVEAKALGATCESGDRCADSICIQNEERVCGEFDAECEWYNSKCPQNTKCNATFSESGTCVPFSELGELNDPCSSSIECAGYCNGTHCQNIKAAGVECDSDAECTGQCSPVYTCKSLDDYAKPGEPCNYTVSCYMSTCNDTFDGFCVEQEYIALGSLDDGESPTDYPISNPNTRLYCKSKIVRSGICVSIGSVADGEKCSDEIECSNLDASCKYDDSTGNSTCVGPLNSATGGPCSDTSDCVLGSVCNDYGECGAVKAAGDTCSQPLIGGGNNLFCTCDGTNPKLIDYPEIKESNQYLREYYTNCVDEDSTLAYTYSTYYTQTTGTNSILLGLEGAFVIEQMGYDQATSGVSATCHQSAIRLLCRTWCPLIATQSTVKYSEAFGTMFLEHQTTFDCTAGTATVDTTKCPRILLKNCGTFYDDFFNEYRDEWRYPRMDGSELPAPTDETTGGESSGNIFAFVVVVLAIFAMI